MKSALNTFKSTPDEAQRWRAALVREDKSLSDICRKALNRFSDRVEKKEGRNDG